MKKETHLLGVTILVVSLLMNICLYGVIFYYSYMNNLDFNYSMINLVGFGTNGVIFVLLTAICYIFGIINLIISFFLREDEYEYIDDDDYAEYYEYEDGEDINV